MHRFSDFSAYLFSFAVFCLELPSFCLYSFIPLDFLETVYGIFFSLQNPIKILFASSLFSTIFCISSINSSEGILSSVKLWICSALSSIFNAFKYWRYFKYPLYLLNFSLFFNIISHALYSFFLAEVSLSNLIRCFLFSSICS